jgi:hypothetical protein
MFMKHFLNAIISKKKKKHNILDIIKISKSMEPNKCIHKKSLKCLFKCFLWVQENQGLMFLVVPSKDGLALIDY